MPHPRLHDLDDLMDAARQLAIDNGIARVTVRALSEATSVSNGAIYHAFGSRAGLLGRMWLRDARRLLDAQATAVDAALDAERSRAAAVDAVVAAADAPAAFLRDQPRAGRFLLSVTRSQLLVDAELPPETATEMRTLDTTLTKLFIRLADGLWGRADRASVAVIRDCVVELPSALLLRGQRDPDDATRARVAAAVRAVLSVDPGPIREHRSPRTGPRP